MNNMLSKTVSDLLNQSGIQGIKDDCLIFTGKIPKSFETKPPADKIVILIQDIQNLPDKHGSNLIITKSQIVQVQIFYPSVFSENNTEISSELNIDGNDTETFEDRVLQYLQMNNWDCNFGSGCLVDPSTNRLTSTFHFNYSKFI